MNLLIYFGDQLCPTNGGTERVACLLCNHLIHRGINIYCLACRPVNSPQAVESEFLPDMIEAPTCNNICAVNDIIKKYNIDVILNEGGFGEVSKLFSHEHIPNHIKIISHLHFDPLRGRKGYYQSLYLPLSLDRQGVKNLIEWLKSPYHKIKLLRSIKARFENMLENSDSVVVLCHRHKNLLKRMVNTLHNSKIIDITNPLSFAPPYTDIGQKRNEIVYVGRLDYNKRVDRILKTWGIISRKNIDWHLTIVGYGTDIDRLENISRELGLVRITFAGRTNPQPLYEKAKILLMTSNTEGTPMVIQEAMSYGVVPIVMDSFSAASDMITSGYDGIITKAFNIKAFAKEVNNVISDQKYWQMLSSNALATIKNYNNEKIFVKWDSLLAQLTNNN